MYVHFEDTNLATCVCSLKQENLQKSIELPAKSLNNNSVLLSIRVIMITLVFLQSLVQFQFPMLKQGTLATALLLIVINLARTLQSWK